MKNNDFKTENQSISTKNQETMKKEKMNLLFIEGNRQKIDKKNVADCYNKIKNIGYIQSMQIEYISIEEAMTHLNGRKLYKVEVQRNKGEGNAIISNFKIVNAYVAPSEYQQFDGVVIDGQHRSIALMFDELKTTEASYQEVEIPKDIDILTYVALRNNSKSWKNEDFYNSDIKTGNTQIDYMLEKCKDYTPAFIFAIYSLPTVSLNANQIKAIQLGYKKAADFGKLQLDEHSQELGERIMDAIKENPIFTKDKLTGRLGKGLKNFYKSHDIEAVIEVLKRIDRDNWDKHFYKGTGKSLEIKGYEEAFEAIYNESESSKEVA